jgi:hypothetical protein
MEEIEISSWLTLDALKKAAQIAESVGNLQSGHFMSVFCTIEEDYLELCYSDTASNFIRRYDDKEEFQLALEKRKEEEGEAPFDEERRLEESLEEEEGEDNFGYEEE